MDDYTRAEKVRMKQEALGFCVRGTLWRSRGEHIGARRSAKP
jgi:hypothetical protein